MKNFLIGVKFRLLNNTYNKESYRINFDLLTLKEMIEKCKSKNLKQELRNYYNELYLLKLEKESK